jgi:hypothetical protein
MAANTMYCTLQQFTASTDGSKQDELHFATVHCMNKHLTFSTVRGSRIMCYFHLPDSVATYTADYAARHHIVKVSEQGKNSFPHHSAKCIHDNHTHTWPVFLFIHT